MNASFDTLSSCRLCAELISLRRQIRKKAFTLTARHLVARVATYKSVISARFVGWLGHKTANGMPSFEYPKLTPMSSFKNWLEINTAMKDMGCENVHCLGTLITRTDHNGSVVSLQYILIIMVIYRTSPAIASVDYFERISAGVMAASSSLRYWVSTRKITQHWKAREAAAT